MDNHSLRKTSTTSYLIVLLLVVSFAVSSSAKRFDCRMFCKETGFHGMVGGCRCSFTLFTAKRAIRDPIDVAYLNRKLRLQSPKMDQEPHSTDDYFSDSHEIQINSEPVNPKFRNIRSSVSETGDISTKRSDSVSPVKQATLGIVLKRQEIEQDLDNGDKGDFLRLSY